MKNLARVFFGLSLCWLASLALAQDARDRAGAQTQQPQQQAQPQRQQPPSQPTPGAEAPARPAPAPAQPSAPVPVLRQGEVLFNFQDADIQAVIKTVSQMTGRNFLIDPRVKGRVTIISAKPVSAAAGYQIFLSALKAQGFAAVEGPVGIIKVVPEGEAKQNARVSVDRPRGGDQWTTQIVNVEHGSAVQMVPLLRPLMAPSGLLSVYAPANILVITDYADNIRRLLKIVTQIDQPGTTEVVVIPVEHASALDMAQLISRLVDVAAAPAGQPGAAPGGGEPRVSVVPDLRTNSLLVRSDNPGRLTQLRSLVTKLDVPARRDGNTRVVYLRNAEAGKLVEVLRGLLAAEQRQAAPQQQAAGGTQQVAARSAVEASLIQADEASNALIINAPDAVYNNLRAVIEKLDIRRAQVFVEALIAEVTTDKAAEFGFQWAAATSQGDQAIAGLTNFPGGPGLVETALQGTVGSGLSIALLGNTITLPDGQEIFGLGALARALETDANANILSTPNLLTLDNAEAQIHIGQNVPLVTGQFTQSAAGTPITGVNPFATIDRRDIGLRLKLKPQISEGNGVKLQIYQEVSSLAPSSQVASDIILNKRTLETVVTVEDGYIIALGGLIQENVQDTVSAVSLLGRIPFLGELFKYQQRTKTKTNLMIFLRPVIVRDPIDTQRFTQDRYEYIRNQQRDAQLRPSLVLPTYSSPLLPAFVQPPAKEEVKPADIESPAGAAQPQSDDAIAPGNSDQRNAPTEPAALLGPNIEPQTF